MPRHHDHGRACFPSLCEVCHCCNSCPDDCGCPGCQSCGCSDYEETTR